MLDEASKPHTKISAHREFTGTYHLPFGMSAALAIFQRILETLLHGVANVCAYLDEILVTDKTSKEHLRILGVLKQIENSRNEVQ